MHTFVHIEGSGWIKLTIANFFIDFFSLDSSFVHLCKLELVGKLGVMTGRRFRRPLMNFLDMGKRGVLRPSKAGYI